jgi:formylglycine-generating enzyme required for sulfatase activity
MSATLFTADIDLSKLDAGIAQSNKNVSDYVKNVEKAGNAVDDTFNKVGSTIQSTADKLKAISDEMKAVYAAMMKAINVGDMKTADPLAERLSQLRAQKEELLKESEGAAKQQAEVNNKVDKSQTGVVSSLKKWALGLVSLGAIMKVTKSIIESTDTVSDKFEEIITGAKSAVDYFFKSISVGDWGNLIGGMEKAAQAGAEFARVMDNLRDKRNEADIAESEAQIKIGELREQTYLKADSNNATRKAALIEIMDLEKGIFTQKQKNDEIAFKAMLALTSAQSNVPDFEIKRLLKEYSSLEAVIEKGKEYNQIKNLLNKPNLDTNYAKQLRSELALMGQSGEKASEYAKSIGKITDEQRKAITDLWVVMNRDQAAYYQSIRRYGTQLAQVNQEMIDRWHTEIEAGNKLWEDRNNINKKITDAQKELNDALVEGSDTEITAIALRISKLEEELRIREKLAKAVVDAMEFKGFAPTLAETGQLNAPTFGIHLAKKPSDKKVREALEKEFGSLALAPDSKDHVIEVSEAQKKINAQLKEELERRRQIRESIAGLILQMAEAMGMNEKGIQQLGTALDSFTKLASGDFIGAATGMISNLIALIPNQAEKFQGQITAINLALEEQNRLIEQASRYGGEDAARKQYILTLEQKELNIIKALNYAAGQGRNTDELLASLIEVRNSIADAKQELSDFLSGGITENTLADAIAQGFKEGKTSVDDFSDYLNTELTDAITNIFTQQLLNSPQMKTFAADLKSFMEDNVLTPAEVAKLREEQMGLVNANRPNWEALTQGLNLGGSMANAGLSGQIQRSITEETGTELAGLFRRFADDERSIKDYSKMGVNHLVAIEANTFNTVQELVKANGKLDQVIDNTKKVYTGSL